VVYVASWPLSTYHYYRRRPVPEEAETPIPKPTSP
jgi:hypothetical protein